MKRIKTDDMVITAVFAALIAVFSLIAIPTPLGVPLTLQTFIIALTGFTLGSFRSAAAVLVYITLGAVGLPVFSGFQGGFGALLGMTGGFIFGFIPFAFLCGIKNEKKVFRFIISLAGLTICHILGVLWFSVYSSSLSSAFLTASAPYLPKDILGIVAAMAVSAKLTAIIQKFN